MEYVLTAAEMKAFDNMAIHEYGIGSLVLMERAALQTVKAIIDNYGKDISVGIVAGSGNNGGDGIAIARILKEEGICAEIIMIGDLSRLTTETAAQLETAQKLDIPICYEIKHLQYDVIVDAIFGIGLTRMIEGKFKETIEAVNASNAKIVAVDIPSGVHSDNGAVMGCAVKADLTVTFAYRKLGLLLYPGASYAGKVLCVSIGIPQAVVQDKRKGVVTFSNAKEDLQLPDRNPAGNKGTFGKVLLIAGSKKMGGACFLSALSAFRAGAGMVKIFTASDNRDYLLKTLPEAMIDTYEEDETGSISQKEANTLITDIAWADVVAIGPGISLSDKAKVILKRTLNDCSKSMVMDADALNILSQEADLLNSFAFANENSSQEIIFTPHLGEFSRLTNMPIEELKKNLIVHCKNFTKRYNVSLVCKDARTIVAKRGRLTYLNSSGNHGMATAGSGDVLTGIITGFLAQNMSGFEAAVMGTYIHGLAGDMAKDKMSAYYIMAQDIIQSLPFLTHEQENEKLRRNEESNETF